MFAAFDGLAAPYRMIAPQARPRTSNVLPPPHRASGRNFCL